MKHTYNSLFIDGGWVPSHSTEVNTVVGASTEEAIGPTPVGDARDVDAAVTAGRRAFDGTGWSDLGPLERADTLERFADEIGEALRTHRGNRDRRERIANPLSVVANSSSGLGVLRYYPRRPRHVEDRPWTPTSWSMQR
jgi:aldehyde dehydrogenase (NAD+)